jgi:hypothetical protein
MDSMGLDDNICLNPHSINSRGEDVSMFLRNVSRKNSIMALKRAVFSCLLFTLPWTGLNFLTRLVWFWTTIFFLNYWRTISSTYTLKPWRWRQYIPPKHWYPPTDYMVPIQKTTIWIIIKKGN